MSDNMFVRLAGGIVNKVQRTLITTVIALVTVAAIAAGICSCATSSGGETRNDVSDAIDEVLSDNEIPGAVAKASLGSEGPWVFARGEADIETNEPIKAQDKFRVASITKTFTAEMVLILADRGKLELDNPVDEYVSGVPNGDRITVRMLLNHTSGIEDEDPTGILQKETNENPLRKWEPRELFEAYTGGKPQGEPGAGYEYSNAGYVLLGIMIEEITGKPVQEFLEESITGPLQLEDTYFPEGPDIREPYAHGYDGTKDVTRVDPSWDFTAGGMVSTAVDLYRWAKAFAEGELLSPEMLAQQKDWVEIPGGRGEIKTGLGMENLFGWLGKNGDNTGWQADMYYKPEKKATFVVLMNKESTDGSDLGAVQQAFAGVANALVPDSIPRWYVEAITPEESK